MTIYTEEHTQVNDVIASIGIWWGIQWSHDTTEGQPVPKTRYRLLDLIPTKTNEKETEKDA